MGRAYSKKMLDALFNQGDVGICSVLAVILAVWTIIIADGDPNFTIPSIAFLVDMCRLPHYIGAACRGIYPEEVIRCIVEGQGLPIPQERFRPISGCRRVRLKVRDVDEAVQEAPLVVVMRILDWGAFARRDAHNAPHRRELRKPFWGGWSALQAAVLCASQLAWKREKPHDESTLPLLKGKLYILKTDMYKLNYVLALLRNKDTAHSDASSSSS
ncbi:g336 [Coccomyxa viridis]|uniref:G336 protein n=1 Tax=Coccomyxa viridis TaxID=1274662 RepID=A0ABP1FFH5_9CHLO